MTESLTAESWGDDELPLFVVSLVVSFVELMPFCRKKAQEAQKFTTESLSG